MDLQLFEHILFVIYYRQHFYIHHSTLLAIFQHVVIFLWLPFSNQG